MDSSDLRCGDSSVGGVPVCCIICFYRRTVLHAGFACVQDDSGLRTNRHPGFPLISITYVTFLVFAAQARLRL